MRKKMAGLLALLFVMIAALTGCSKNAVDGTAEAINVDGVSVPMGEVNFYLRYQQVQMQQFYGSLFGPDFMNNDLMGTGVPYGETVRETVVETMEELYIVQAHAEELGISLSEDEKNAAAEAAKAFVEENDHKALSAMNADEATVTHVLEMLTLRSKVYNDRAATIDTEVDTNEVAQKRISFVLNSTSGTTDADGNVTELTDEELAEKKSQIEEVLAEAKESGDIKAAAEAHELNATSTTYGKDDDVLNESVREAADKLSDGEYSDVIETDNGYYIVYMESTFDEEATQTETENVLAERESEAYDAWFEPLKEASEITVNDERIQTLTFERTYTVPTEETEETEEAAPAEEAEATEEAAPAEETEATEEAAPTEE